MQVDVHISFLLGVALLRAVFIKLIMFIHVLEQQDQLIGMLTNGLTRHQNSAHYSALTQGTEVYINQQENKSTILRPTRRQG